MYHTLHSYYLYKKELMRTKWESNTGFLLLPRMLCLYPVIESENLAGSWHHPLSQSMQNPLGLRGVFAATAAGPGGIPRALSAAEQDPEPPAEVPALSSPLMEPLPISASHKQLPQPPEISDFTSFFFPPLLKNSRGGLKNNFYFSRVMGN